MIRERRRTASTWRADYMDDAHRETAWIWYRVGATWRERDRVRVRSIQYALNEAERLVRWDATNPEENTA